MERDKPTLEVEGLRNPDGTIRKGAVLNPTGIGGLQERPEDINFGGRPKNAESFAYWYRVFKDMSVKELKEWPSKNPEETRTVASDLAFTRVINSKKDLKEFQEVADRSEGRAVQRSLADFTSDGETIKITAINYLPPVDNTEKEK